ncbi:MAG: hypothetical protein Q4D02_00100 [Clostridia bacterium]|nr:hypothetical protein [Clostridia bacterium]
MKITDFALIFMAVTLPMIIIVYVNVSFTIKSQELEMYYQKIIDVSMEDAVYEMKEVENSDKEIDYGYSGTSNKKININAQVGVDTFFKTLYKNLDIDGNEAAESYLQLFVPAVAIIDYNGVQVSSNQEFQKINEDGTEETMTKHVLSPKRYYTYTYSIVRDGFKYTFVDGIPEDRTIVSVHTIEFTMDDYITHRGYNYYTNRDIETNSFYLDDSKNNRELTAGAVSLEEAKLRSDLVSHLLDIRKSIIVDTVTEELNQAVNSNNRYARNAGITYTFSFPATSEEEMYNAIENVGMIAFVQGISIGNKYLNSKAFGISSLEQTTRYYFTAPNEKSKYQMNLYHKDLNCPEYRISKINDMVPKYATSKQQAASAVTRGTLNNVKQVFEGFYPCPLCNP